MGFEVNWSAIAVIVTIITCSVAVILAWGKNTQLTMFHSDILKELKKAIADLRSEVTMSIAELRRENISPSMLDNAILRMEQTLMKASKEEFYTRKEAGIFERIVQQLIEPKKG